MPALPVTLDLRPRLSEELIVARLAEGGPAVVALSGGVDSATVAHLAHRALGDRVLAVTLTGPAVSAREVDRASSVAARIGIRHRLRPVDPLVLPDYRANPSNRCYFCRVVDAAALTEEARREGYPQLLDGVQLDDLGEDRPGLRAMEEAGFHHPLLEARWGKSPVRAYARRHGLPNWDTPSEACLASRIRHGVEISGERLHRVERAEEVVRREGFRQVRVRDDGSRARIEVGRDELSRLLEEPLATRVRRAVAAEGFAQVEIEARGYPVRAGG
jgi:pyridinium-3,5-biscarboxylic acid mononucleotide sulfurtransferase